MYKRLFSLFLLLFTIAGCTDLYVPPSHSNADLVPPVYTLASTATEQRTPWWRQFASPELDHLIAASLESNFSLHQAWARLSQAQATAVKAGAERYPRVSGLVGAAHNRTGGQQEDETSRDDYSLGLAAAYEVDLWGRVKAARYQAQEDVLASREAVSAAAISLSAEVAIAWLDLVGARMQEAQLQKQLDLNRKLLQLVEWRFAASKASALDVYQQQQTVAAIEGALIPTRTAQETALHRLALLTGRPATEAVDAQQTLFPAAPSLPVDGLTADLLGQRPDIRAQAHRLESAAWSIAEARADRLPQLNLTGEFSYNAGVLESLLEAWFLRLAADFTASLIDGGAKVAEVERTRAVADEDLAAYRELVITAIKEVEDALTQEKQLRKSIANIDKRIKLIGMAYREATWRYLNGLSDYLPVLREQVNLITTQQDRIISEKELLQARVRLHRALGGTWTDDLMPAPALSFSDATSSKH